MAGRKDLRVKRVLADEIVATKSIQFGGAELNVTEFTALDGVTAGTVSASKALIVDANRALATLGALTLDGAIQQAASGTGYSFNLISVTGTTASGNLRGWRVNVTTSDSITHGDLQCVHGYLTTGSGVTLAAGAAVYPLSAWIDVPADITTGTGNVIAGLRVIFDHNTNDLSGLAGGGESALFYGQTWAAAGAIEHGLRVIAGAGSTIKNALSIGGSGTFSNIIDITEWEADTDVPLLTTSVDDAGDRQFFIKFGDKATSAAINTAYPTAGIGSLYFSTAGYLFMKNAHTGAADDWQAFDSAATV